MKLNDLECLKNRFLHVFVVAFDPMLFKLADNKDMHTILMSSNLSQIGPRTTVRCMALRVLKYPHRLILGKLVTPLFLGGFLTLDLFKIFN